MSVEELLRQAEALSPQDQSRLVKELSRSVLKRNLAATGSKPEIALLIEDSELDQIIREARKDGRSDKR
jgi:hypothetical protein